MPYTNLSQFILFHQDSGPCSQCVVVADWYIAYLTIFTVNYPAHIICWLRPRSGVGKYIHIFLLHFAGHDVGVLSHHPFHWCLRAAYYRILMRVHSSKRFFYLDSSWLGSNKVVIFITYFARGHGRSCTSAIRWCKGTLITEIRRGVVESLILGIRYEFLFRHHLSTSCSSVFSWGTPSIVIISGMRKRVRACCSRGNWELSPGPNRGILSDQLLSYRAEMIGGRQLLWYTNAPM